jgi:hypothetical protein
MLRPFVPKHDASLLSMRGADTGPLQPGDSTSEKGKSNPSWPSFVNEHTGRPLGTAEFIQYLEKATQRQLALQKREPREKIVTDQRQRQLTFNP